MGKSLLIIDDEPSWLGVMSRLFKSCGYDIHTAGSCREGLRLARLKSVDCILLDYNLADGTARDVALPIRGDKRLRAVPIVVLSGLEKAELDAYRECQADSFIAKDSGFDKILAVVESVLRRRSWDSDILESGDLRLDRKALALYCKGMTPVELSREQLELLSLLVERQSQFVSYDEIGARVFPARSGEVSREAVRSLVYRIRKRLGPRLAARLRQSLKKGWIYMPPARAGVSGA